METTSSKPRLAPVSVSASGVAEVPLPDRLARRMLLRRMAAMGGGRLILRDPDGEHGLGDPAAGPTVHIDVVRPRFYRRLLLGGSLAAGASYIDGDWECADLAALFGVFIRGTQQAGMEFERGPARLAGAAARLWHRLRFNSRRGSRRNIRDHYDLGNDLFRAFLDPSMTYSAGVFEHPEATLAEAQAAKLDRICRKLDLGPDTHVLEIGTGWGSFAIHAARHYDCRVTTTTISREQHDLAAERIRAAGLGDRIDLRLDDYRDLTGQYDRLVSIEMIEAVGHANLGRFFRTCCERLRPDGRMLLQVITTGDPYYEVYRRSADFIQRYVFPGSLCPAPGALAAAIAGHTDLRTTHVEDLTPDYAETLRRWRASFAERADEIRRLGYPERFLRLWDYYLQYCEAGFAERHVGDLQMLLERPGSRAAPVRPQLTGAGA